MFNGKEEVVRRHHFQRPVRRRRRPTAAALSEELRVRSQNDPKSIFWVVTLDEDIRSEIARGLPLAADDRAEGAATPRRRTAPRSSPRRRAASAGTWTTAAAAQGRGALGSGLVPRQRPQPGRQRATSARPPSRSSATCCRSSTTASTRPRPRRRPEEGRRRAVHRREPQRPPAGLQPAQPAARRARQAGVQDRRARRSPRSWRRSTTEANYGEQATGKFLEDEFSKPPFGWDFEAVRLLVLSLLRAGAIEAVSKGVTIDSATTAQAKERLLEQQPLPVDAASARRRAST